MGVTADGLAELYPRLYHMAEPDSWESILRHGLLSTSALLTLFSVQGESRRKIELCRRENSQEIAHPTHGRAVIRDQKPIIESKLKLALRDCTPEDWYRTLNSRVFFWLTMERLITLLSARQYRGKPHAVLTLETRPLVNDFEHAVTLSPMNSGNTLPFAHPRGLTTFMRMRDYPFEERLKRGRYYTVVELAVDGGVPNIGDYTTRADLVTWDGNQLTKLKTLYAR
jgi:hypothetical protein